MLSISKLRYQRQLWSVLSRTSFSTAVVDKRDLDQIITKVDNDVRRSGRIQKRDVLSVFESVKKFGFSKPSHSLVLLRCCGSLLCEVNPDARNQLIDEVWSTIKSNHINLNVSHYNALLSVYNENSKPFSPTDLLAEMENNGVEPNRVTYQRLLHRYCQTGDISGALKILEHMKSKSLPLSEAIFNSLILGYARSGDLDASMAVIDQMKSANIEVTNNTYRNLLCALCENLKNSPEVEKKLDETLKVLESNEVEMADKDWLDVIFAIAKNDEKSPLIDKFLQKRSETVAYNNDCFITIVELVNEKKLDTALKLLYTMKLGEEAKEAHNVGNFFIAQMVRAGIDHELVFKICDDLHSNGTNIHGYLKAAEIAFENKDLETSKVYLKTFLEKTGRSCKPHFLWPLLAKCKTDDEILSVVLENFTPISRDASFSSVADTFVDYIWPKLKMDRNIFIERCKEAGFGDTTIISSLLKYTLQDGSLNEVAKIVNDERYFNKNLLGTYVIRDLVNVYLKSGDVKNMISILKKFASTATTTRDPVGLFLQNLANVRNLDVDGRFLPLLIAMKKHHVFITSAYQESISKKITLKDKERNLLVSLVTEVPLEARTPQEALSVTVEDLEKQYEDLLARGIVARGTIRQMVRAYCMQPVDKSTEMGRAKLQATRDRIEQLLPEIKDTSGSITKALQAVLVNFYVTRCEDLDAALELKRIDDAPLDAYKTIRLARLMISKDKVQDAINLLNEEAVKEREHMSDIPKGRIDVAIVEMLNAAAELTKDSSLVKELVSATCKFCNIRGNHTMFAPVIKAHLLNNDFAKAMEEYRYYVKEHNCAPGVVDLMKHAMKNEDAEKLQEIADLSTGMQGYHTTLFDLTIAFIQCGKIKEAKKTLSTAGLRIHERRLKSFSMNCVRENEIHVLEQLIPLMQSANVFDVNIEELYYDLLRGYSRMGNVNKVHEIWTKMQEQNITPSDKTITLVDKFFEASGKNMSFAVTN